MPNQAQAVSPRTRTFHVVRIVYVSVVYVCRAIWCQARAAANGAPHKIHVSNRGSSIRNSKKRYCRRKEFFLDCFSYQYIYEYIYIYNHTYIYIYICIHQYICIIQIHRVDPFALSPNDAKPPRYPILPPKSPMLLGSVRKRAWLRGSFRKKGSILRRSLPKRILYDRVFDAKKSTT